MWKGVLLFYKAFRLTIFDCWMITHYQMISAISSCWCLFLFHSLYLRVRVVMTSYSFFFPLFCSRRGLENGPHWILRFWWRKMRYMALKTPLLTKCCWTHALSSLLVVLFIIIV